MVTRCTVSLIIIWCFLFLTLSQSLSTSLSLFLFFCSVCLFCVYALRIDAITFHYFISAYFVNCSQISLIVSIFCSCSPMTMHWIRSMHVAGILWNKRAVTTNKHRERATRYTKHRWMIEKPLKEHRFTRSLCKRVLKSECCAFQTHVPICMYINIDRSDDMRLCIHILKFIGLIYWTLHLVLFYKSIVVFCFIWFSVFVSFANN